MKKAVKILKDTLLHAIVLLGATIATAAILNFVKWVEKIHPILGILLFIVVYVWVTFLVIMLVIAAALAISKLANFVSRRKSKTE